METSLQETLELAGFEGGEKEVSVGEWRDGQSGGVSLAQTPRRLDTTEHFGRTSSHHSYFYLFHFCYMCIY